MIDITMKRLPLTPLTPNVSLLLLQQSQWSSVNLMLIAVTVHPETTGDMIIFKSLSCRATIQCVVVWRCDA